MLALAYEAGEGATGSLVTETRKPVAARGIGLLPRAPASWWGQCAVESPSHLRHRPPESSLMLIAAFRS